MKRIKRLWVVLAIIIAILIILNPGVKRFKEFRGSGYCDHPAEVRRTGNYFIFSLYEEWCGSYKRTYIGVLGNFIDVTGN
jgi:hypothetical protein